jgi:hypothetical protein
MRLGTEIEIEMVRTTGSESGRGCVCPMTRQEVAGLFFPKRRSQCRNVICWLRDLFLNFQSTISSLNVQWRPA